MAYNLLNDIDETLRQERLSAMWKEWRAPLFVGVAVAVITLIGVELWRNYTHEARANAATAYWQASQAGADAEAQYAVVAESSDGTYRAMAKLQLASLKPEQANTYLEQVMDDRGAPSELRELAALQLGQRLIATDAAKAKDILKDVAEGSGPFKLMGHEMLGILAKNEGNTEEAKTHYAIIIKEGNLSSALVTRARVRSEALSQ